MKILNSSIKTSQFEIPKLGLGTWQLENENCSNIVCKALYDTTPSALTLAWLMTKDGVAAIPKSSCVMHLKSNLDSLTLKIADEDIKTLDQLAKVNQRMIDPDFAPTW